ncbi:hypothetical protein [Pseudoalteromonas fuliginea]|uniref:hypothetical protein n=1 Tax=Pseudoalteromonas fuliginea TaxID=1872678 RepID=UPI0031822DF0
MSTLKSLAESIKGYKNQNVIVRFSELYGVDLSESEQIFEDMKLWLVLAKVAKIENSNKPFVIDNALLVIDEMWHNFILFTKDYSAFCDNYFGHYLHHNPTSVEENNRQKEVFSNMSIEERQSYMMEKLRWQYEFTMVKLGKDIFIRWYQYYPNKFTKESLAKLSYESTKKKSEFEDKVKKVA